MSAIAIIDETGRRRGWIKQDGEGGAWEAMVIVGVYEDPKAAMGRVAEVANVFDQAEAEVMGEAGGEPLSP